MQGTQAQREGYILYTRFAEMSVVGIRWLRASGSRWRWPASRPLIGRISSSVVTIAAYESYARDKGKIAEFHALALAL